MLRDWWYLKEVHPILMKADADYHFTIVGRNPEQGFLEELRGHEQVTVIPNAENLSEQISPFALYCTDLIR